MSSKLERQRDSDIRRLRAQADECNRAMQRTTDHDQTRQIIEQRQAHLDGIARLERLTADELRARYEPEADPEAAARLAQTYRNLNTPEARQREKERLWREVSEQSAERARLDAIESEVRQAKLDAATEAERLVRQKYADAHQAA